MGCGCSKGGNRNTGRATTNGFGTGSQQRNTNNNITVQNVEQNSSVAPNQTPSNKPIDRRSIEKIRREAIKKALGH